ncbi:MAG: hypothetical protein ACYCW6_29410, partial [Candidatus Xenobia bacterium]
MRSEMLSPVTQLVSAPRLAPPAASAAPAAPQPAETYTPGPVPDYARLNGVVVHQLLSDLCPPLLNRLRDLLGPQLFEAGTGYGGPRSGFPDPNVVWVRDYHPAFVHARDGRMHVVKFESENPVRNRWDDSMYVPVQPPAPGMQFYPICGKQWLQTDRVPLRLENGNLVATGEYALLTDRVMQQNGGKSHDEVLNTLANGLQMDRDKLIVLPRLPGEATGHVDLYVMALGPREVMLPQIPDACFNVVTYPHEQATGHAVQRFLDEQAKALEARGLKVDRLPMMPPTFLHPSPDDPTGWLSHFDSPANSLLLDFGGKRHVLLPTVNLDG